MLPGWAPVWAMQLSSRPLYVLSLRYRRLSQIEEGFGITMAPVEKLTREVYGNDPATHFQSRGTGLREAIMMARMQKAMAVMQFKLEAQIMERHPEYHMQHRALMQNIDLERGTVRAGWPGVSLDRYCLANV